MFPPACGMPLASPVSTIDGTKSRQLLLGVLLMMLRGSHDGWYGHPKAAP